MTTRTYPKWRITQWLYRALFRLTGNPRFIISYSVFYEALAKPSEIEEAKKWKIKIRDVPTTLDQ